MKWGVDQRRVRDGLQAQTFSPRGPFTAARGAGSIRLDYPIQIHPNHS